METYLYYLYVFNIFIVSQIDPSSNVFSHVFCDKLINFSMDNTLYD